MILSNTLRMFISLAAAVFRKYGLLLFILIPSLCIDSAASICNNVGPNNDENLSNTCDWSTWYPWNCSCCGYTETKQFQFRKRAICCEKNVNLPLCLKHCNYSADSDTQYANCSKECARNNGKICTETPPVDITLIELSFATSSPTANSTDFASVTTPSSSVKTALASSFTTTQLSTDTQTSTFSSLSSLFSATTHANISSDTSLITASVRPTNESQPHGNFSTGESGNERTQDSIGIILGAVFGSIAGLAILACTLVFLKRKPAGDNTERAESTQRDSSRHNANAHYHSDKTGKDS